MVCPHCKKEFEEVEKVFSPEEVASHLRIAEKTVKDMLRAGEIPGFKIGRKGVWRVKAKDLQEFINSCPIEKGEPKREYKKKEKKSEE